MCIRDSSNRTEVQVINYEAYLIGLKGTKFETGRKRCDFILHETGGSCDSFYILNEQTSTKKNIENLSKPILDKDKNVIYPGGKYEKAEIQLLETMLREDSLMMQLEELALKEKETII